MSSRFQSLRPSTIPCLCKHQLSKADRSGHSADSARRTTTERQRLFQKIVAFFCFCPRRVCAPSGPVRVQAVEACLHHGRRGRARNVPELGPLGAPSHIREDADDEDLFAHVDTDHNCSSADRVLRARQQHGASSAAATDRNARTRAPGVRRRRIPGRLPGDASRSRERERQYLSAADARLARFDAVRRHVQLRHAARCRDRPAVGRPRW